jgi:small subunit ribosomal protein S36
VRLSEGPALATEPDAPSGTDVAPLVSQPESAAPRRRIPGVVWIITALHLMLLLLFATLLPAWRAPDEPQHVDLVLHVANTQNYPSYDGLFIDPGILKSLRIVRFSQNSKHLLASEAPPRGARPSFRELAKDAPPALRRGPNQQPQHPPLYYVTLATAWRVVRAVVPGDALTSFDRELWVLRVLSALLIVPIPLIAWALANRLRLRRRACIVAALIPLGIPQFTHIGAAVNNDTLLVLLGSLVLLPSLRFARGDLANRAVLLAGLLCGLALLTKGFGFAFFLTALLAIVIGARIAGRRRALIAASMLSATTLLTGGWWWIRNLLEYHALQPQRQRVPRPGFVPDWDAWTRTAVPGIFRRFWGDFGWFDVSLPTFLYIAASVVCGALVILAFARGTRLVPTPERRVFFGQLIVLAVPLLVLFVFVMAQAARSYRNTGGVAFVQGRYLFGGVVGIAALIAVAVSTLGPRAVRSAPLVTLAAVLGMQAVAVTQILNYYWGPAGGGLRSQIRALVDWSPWDPWFLVVLGILGIGLTIALLYAFVAELLRDHSPAPAKLPEAVL